MSEDKSKIIKAPLTSTIIVYLYALYLLKILVSIGIGEFFKAGDDIVQIIFTTLVVVEHISVYVCAISAFFSFRLFYLSFYVALASYVINIIYFYSVEVLSDYEGSVEYITNWFYIVAEYWHILLYAVSAYFLLRQQIANKHSRQDAANDAPML
ncbi:hypothetical protein NBRC116492_30210 [Aurantivibrio infirmus]